MKQLYRFVTIALIGSTLWAGTIRADEQAEMRMKPALIVIDIQNEYLPMMSAEERDLALRIINGAIWLFRERELPVIRVYHTDPQYGPKPDTEPFEFPSSVIIEPDDPKIVKNYPSAFKKTDLEKTLRERDCNTLFLCGLSAVGCVLATYHDGKGLDYNVFMIKNAIMSHNATYTTVVEEAFDTVSFTTLKFILDYAL